MKRLSWLVVLGCLSCTDSSPKTGADVGEACSVDTPCVAGAACDEGICVALTCAEGEVVECACSGAEMGQQTCTAEGAYGSCRCGDAGGAGGVGGVGGAGGTGGVGGDPGEDAAASCEDGVTEEQPCGDNGTRSRTCEDGAWSDWGVCESEACEDGISELRACGINNRGESRRSCDDGRFTAWGPCADPDACTDDDTQNEACGLNGNGLRSRACTLGQWGDFGPCDDGDECVADASESRECGLNDSGRETRTCTDGLWGPFADCDDPDVCEEGVLETEPCGAADNGERQRRCESGRWSDFGPCDDPDQVCEAGAIETVVCGRNGRGRQQHECVGERWGPFSNCADPDACIDTAVSRLACGFNGNGYQERMCAAGQWTEFAECVDLDECINDDGQAEACGLNGNGQRQRFCAGGRWAEWSSCLDSDVCVNGDAERGEVPCGLNGNGFEGRVCSDGQWGPLGECADPDNCVIGTMESEACGRDGMRRRSCPEGQWTEWDECDGRELCPDLENPECGPPSRERCNGLDEDHDGEIDEGLADGVAGLELPAGDFGDAVKAGIDAGIDATRRIEDGSGRANTENHRANFLAILVMLNQRGPDGAILSFVELNDDDQALLVRFMQTLIDGEPVFVNNQAVPYNYVVGGAVGAFAEWIAAGGPDDVGAEVGVAAALDNGVIALARVQGQIEPNNVGGFSYQQPHQDGDLSITHFVGGGLSAAMPFNEDAAAILAGIGPYLISNQNEDGSYGYNANSAGSSSMTSVGVWLAGLTGSEAEDPAVADGIDWMVENYTYDSMIGGFTPTSTYYYFWGLVKAISVVDVDVGRFPGRVPADEGYPNATPGPYFDVAITLLGWQDPQGQWGTDVARAPTGWDRYSSQYFALLTLQGVYRDLGPDRGPRGGRPAACNDGVDNDGDGRSDLEDPDCAFLCTRTEEPRPACFNDLDDDDDGRIDLDDPGCQGRFDNDEADPGLEARAACSNGRDDDEDGDTDGEDQQCSGPFDLDESGDEIGVCSNGDDDDGDGIIDWPADPGCRAAGGDSEVDPAVSPVCANGLDDDGDGAMDWPDDIGCRSASGTSEFGPSQTCQNSLDDDEDGLVDYPFDPGCRSPADGDEVDPLGAPVCSNGVDDDRDGLTDFPVDPGCAARGDTDEAGPTMACANGEDDDGDGLIDFPADPGCQWAGDDLEESLGPPGECANGLDDDRDGAIDWPNDPSCASASGDRESRERRRFDCSDALDNDEDGLVDGADPGCTNATDIDETDPAEPPECANGVDDDGDGAVDWPADLSCVTAGSRFETDECAAGVEAEVIPRNGAFNGQTTGASDDFTSSCGGLDASDVVHKYTLANPATLRASVDHARTDFAASVSIRSACQADESERVCTSSGDAVLADAQPGAYYIIVDGALTGILRSLGLPIELPADPEEYVATDDINNACWRDGGRDAFDCYGQTSVTIGGTSAVVDITPGAPLEMVVGNSRVRVHSERAHPNILRVQISSAGDAQVVATVVVGGGLGSDGRTVYETRTDTLFGNEFSWLRSTDGGVSDPPVHHVMLTGDPRQQANVEFVAVDGQDPTITAREVTLPVMIYIAPSYLDGDAVIGAIIDDIAPELGPEDAVGNYRLTVREE